MDAVALPFRLNHVNIYFVDDGEGWALVEPASVTATLRAWQSVLTDVARSAADADHRHPFSSRPCRGGRLPVAALRRAAVHGGDGISAKPQIHLDPGALEAEH